MYCFLFFHFDHKLPQVSAGSPSKPWMPLDSQQPSSHCYWLTAFSELLCVCSHSHLHWYETAQTPERGEAGHGQSGCRGRQAGSIGRYHKPLLLPFLTSNPASIKDFCLADTKALTMEAKVFFRLPKSLPQILPEPYDFVDYILRTLQLCLCDYFCICLELKSIMLLMKQTLTL